MKAQIKQRENRFNRPLLHHHDLTGSCRGFCLNFNDDQSQLPLRVRRRAEPTHGDPDTQSWESTARLSPNAARLHDAALELTPQDQGEDRTSRLGRRSSEKSSYCNSGVEFHRYDRVADGTIYVSYNGGWDLKRQLTEAGMLRLK
jgi:hypothetical protein